MEYFVKDGGSFIKKIFYSRLGRSYGGTSSVKQYSGSG